MRAAIAVLLLLTAGAAQAAELLSVDCCFGGPEQPAPRASRLGPAAAVERLEMVPR